MTFTYKEGDRIEIVREFTFDDRMITKVFSNGTFTLDREFLGRKKIHPGADYTTKGFRKGYLGSKDGMEVAFRPKRERV